MKNFCLIAVFILLLAVGCVSVETVTGRDFDSSKVSQIQIGKTTQNKILTMFGDPESRGLISGDIAWRYEYQITRSAGSLKAEEQQIKPFVAEKTLTITFKDGIVRHYTFFEK